MSAGMPELGSKISLISKADIRYEGRLFTVDPQECTIALSNVRSFGTEDRDASFIVQPQNQTYDYILFRGSDIKDIRVVHNVNPIPNDPAIVTLSVPPPLASSGYQAQQQAAQHQQGTFGHQFGSYGMPSSGLGALGIESARILSSELADSVQPPPGIEQPPPPLPHPQQQQQQPPQQPPPQQPPPPQQQQRIPPPQIQQKTQLPPMAAEPSADLIGGRAGTRRMGSGTSPQRKSPTMDQGTQAGTPGAVGTVPSTRQRGRSGPPPPQQQHQVSRDRDQQQQQQDQRNNRSRQTQQGGWQQNNAWQHQAQQMRQQQQQDGWGSQNNRGAWQSNARRGRGRGGGNFSRPPPGIMGSSQGASNRQQQDQRQLLQQRESQNANVAGQKKNVLKFEGDYDFEQANTEFENLRSQLANIKLTATAAGQLPNSPAADTTTPASQTAPTLSSIVKQVNGDDKKEVDSGNETGVGEGEVEDDTEVYYDKTKSFFDNISCEAIERSKGCSQRTDWRHERKLNSETFGVASARRGYRGRGGYYRGGMYRGGGGYRGGYRGGRGGYRNPGQQQQQGGGPMGGQQQQAGQNRPMAAVGSK